VHINGQLDPAGARSTLAILLHPHRTAGSHRHHLPSWRRFLFARAGHRQGEGPALPSASIIISRLAWPHTSTPMTTMTACLPELNSPWVRGWLLRSIRSQCGAGLAGGALQREPRLAYEGTIGNSERPGGQGGLLWQYTKSMGVYRCPLDQTNTADWKARPTNCPPTSRTGDLWIRRRCAENL